MSHGLQVGAANGALLFNSLSHAGGMLIDILSVPVANPSGYKDYTQSYLSGRTLVIIQDQGGAHEFAATSNGATPRVTWEPSASFGLTPFNTGTRVLVFAK